MPAADCIRVISRPPGQADRDVGEKIWRREGEERRADDPARVPEIHPVEEVRGDHRDGQGGKKVEQKASGDDGSIRRYERTREDGLPQSDLHPAAANREQTDAHQKHVPEREETRGEFSIAHTQKPKRQM